MLEWITIVGKGAEVTSSHQARAPTLGELYIRSTSTGKYKMSARIRKT